MRPCSDTYLTPIWHLSDTRLALIWHVSDTQVGDAIVFLSHKYHSVGPVTKVSNISDTYLTCLMYLTHMTHICRQGASECSHHGVVGRGDMSRGPSLPGPIRLCRAREGGGGVRRGVRRTVRNAPCGTKNRCTRTRRETRT